MVPKRPETIDKMMGRVGMGTKYLCALKQVRQMPQSSDEMREKMKARFGSIDITGPLTFLLNQGYSEWSGMITPPLGHKETQDEADCIDFLFEEWDFAFMGTMPGAL